MIKFKYYQEGDYTVQHRDIICDTCGEVEPPKLSSSFIFMQIEDTHYHFCNLKCASKFISAENAKENIEDRFIYGKEKTK